MQVEMKAVSVLPCEGERLQKQSYWIRQHPLAES